MKDLRRRWLLWLFFWLLEMLPIGASTVICVAPNGSDSASGSQEDPLASLVGAKRALRELVKKGLRDDVVVRLRGGIYSVDGTVELTPEELGDGRYWVTLMGQLGENAVVCGSRALPSAWHPVHDNLWVLALPPVDQGTWNFRSLYCNGKSLPRAREPNEGFFTIAQVADDRRTLVLRQKLPAEWSQLSGVQLNTTAQWHFNRQPVASISADRITARRAIGTDASSTRISATSHSRVWLENALAFADAPGEWFLDVAAGNLYYCAATGADPNKLNFRAPVLRELLLVKGDAEHSVKNFRVRNLEIAETDWEMPDEGRLGVQAGAWALDRSRTYSPSAALRVIYANSVSVEDCRFRDLGDGAISFEIGTHNSQIARCDFLRVGADPVQIGRMPSYTGQGHPLHADFADSRSLIDEKGAIPNAQQMWTKLKSTPREAPSEISVADNTFIDCCQVDYGSVALCVTYANHVTIEHNLFRNLPYIAINVGWRWAPGLSNCFSNLVQFNRIEGIMRQAGDGGGVYLVGEQPGTRVLDNYVTDVGRNYWGHGIYADEFSDHMEIARNYVTGVLDHSIFMNKNGPNQNLHDNNGEHGTTKLTSATEYGASWVQFSPERTPPDLSVYGPRRTITP